ncbi:SMI1/KNR4 family protein [Streptomyces sp. NPDC087218]|uniref:SMI1/KNR4 family protein n=1 Tax=Streptomyces sp. NPDC087218 TaxID=3365769 RepID=UPI003808E21D
MTNTEDREIHHIWNRLVQWLHDNAPASAAALRPSAAAEEIVAAEQAIGVPFPAALRTWLMLNNGVQVADGRLDRAPVRDGCFLLDGYHPLSTALIPHVYQRMMPTPGDVNSYRSWWNPRWIPFAADDWSYGFFIDTGNDTIGEWGDYGYLVTGAFPSLAAFFEYALADLRTRST